MDVLYGSMGSIADLVEEGSVSMWGAPIVCGLFGPTVGNVGSESKEGAERHWMGVRLLAVLWLPLQEMWRPAGTKCCSERGTLRGQR